MTRRSKDDGAAASPSLGNIYWLLGGALLGFGLMAVFSIGIPLFLLGIVLVLYRLRRTGSRGFGLVLVGMGLLPAAYLSVRYFTSDRSNTFYPGNWWVVVLVYVALSAAGVVLLLIESRLLADGGGISRGGVALNGAGSASSIRLCVPLVKRSASRAFRNYTGRTGSSRVEGEEI